ncbi:MAG: tyrosine decarboxylase MfnA [Thermoplasmatota archaeon]
MRQEGQTADAVMERLRAARGRDRSLAAGDVLGSMCTAPHELARAAHDLFLETNLGDPDHFPGIAALEKELLADFVALFCGPETAGARYLTGGTEANLLALYAARERGAGKRKVVLPESAHFSFQKAARLLGMELVWVPTGPDGRADVDAMAAALDDQTALLVGVAGTTELGLVDPIDRLSDLAVRTDVPLHVDAAFGGYVLPFLEAAGETPLPFDFRLPGVWSISVDPHKVGQATIPGGVLVLRDEEDWARLAVETPYVSTDKQTTIMGTRPGAAVAACWAVHQAMGRRGFAKTTARLLADSRHLATGLEALCIDLVAPPQLNVVTFRADDPVRLAKALDAAGFRVNVVPRFGAIRIVVNPHVTRDVIDRFLGALPELLETVP